MDASGERGLALQEKRLAALRRLAEAIRASQRALSQGELEAYHASLDEQEGICAELRLVARELQRGGQKTEGLAAPDEGPQALRAGEEIGRQVRAVAAEVRRENRVHAELVRRSRRTVRALTAHLWPEWEPYSAELAGRLQEGASACRA